MSSVRATFLLGLLGACSSSGEKLDSGGGFAGGASTPGWGECAAQDTPSWSGIAAQTVPTPGATNVSPYAPILVFVAASFDAGSVSQDQLTVRVDSEVVSGRFKAITRSTTTVFAFVPSEPWPADSEVKVKIDYVIDTWSFSFSTGPWDAGSIDALTSTADLGFEDAATSEGDDCEAVVDNGTVFAFGDAYIGPDAYGSLAPTEGDQHLLLSSGEVLGGAAIGGTTSYATTRPLDTGGATSVKFDKRFVSEEFDEYVGAVYDDGLFFVVWGPDGIAFKEVAGVNDIGSADSTAGNFPGLTDAEVGPEGTGGKPDLSDIGSPVVLTWVLTDVSDPLFTSVAQIDNIRFE